MEVAALQAGQPAGRGYQSLIRCDHPDTPQGPSDESGSTGISEEENQNAPSPEAVFAHLDQAFSLGQTTVVMWAGMAYRFYRYAKLKQLDLPCFQTRVVDLQAAVVMHLNIPTSQCKDPRSVIRLLTLNADGESWARGSLPYAHAMNAVLCKLLEDGWTPEATPAAVTNGADIGEDAEEMRMDRWEQIRERQNNLGIERRPVPAVTPAFIVLDGEHVSLRQERFSRLIELALVVAHRKEHTEQATYELSDSHFSSLVRVQQVYDTNSYAWQITGIDPEAVRRAPPLQTVIARMAAAAPWDTGVLITWGPDDARVITQNCVKAGIPSPITEIPLVDLQRVFSRFYELGTQQVGLQNAASFLGIETNGLDLHRALDDTLLTWYVLERMLADGWTPQWRPWHRRQANAE